MKHSFKKHCVLFMAALTLATSTAAIGTSVNTVQVDAATRYLTVTVDKAPLRHNYSNTSDIICRIPWGNQVKYQGYKVKPNGNKWYLVEYKGQTGWIYSGNVGA